MYKWFFVFCLISSSLKAQEFAPFARFNSEKKTEYQQKIQKLGNIQNERDKNQERIELAYAYKDYQGLIKALEEEIKAQPQQANLYYRLAGIQGIRSLEVSKIYAPSYLKSMIKNFQTVLQLSPDFIPAIEAYIEVLCKIPAFFGGSEEKAQKWAHYLEQIAPVDGAFAQAMIVRETQGFDAALPRYKKIFRELSVSDLCKNPVSFFKGRSINFPYKIAEMAVLTSSSSEVGLCAIEYFIDQESVYYNIPMEWVYYRKAQLLQSLGKTDKAKSMFRKALEINPKFDRAKKRLF